MTNTLPIQEWLDVIKTEYLEGFVKDGGSSIKFAVPVREDLIPLVQSTFRTTASRLGYLVVNVDSGETRVHMPQEIFFQIAQQIDWGLLARKAVLLLCDYVPTLPYRHTDTIDPKNESMILEAISAANDRVVATSQIARDLRGQLTEAVTQNRKMSTDFRLAMTHLCLTEIDGAGQNQGAVPLIEWLTGLNKRVSNVRRYEIYNSIVRTNARHLLESLLYWVRFVGYSGTVVMLNNARVTVRRNPKDGLQFYSRPAVMDHYELLRELIDGTDRVEGLLMVVLSNQDFLNDDNSSRGYGLYNALKSRIADEVRDRNQANPLSTLVRLVDSTG